MKTLKCILLSFLLSLFVPFVSHAYSGTLTSYGIDFGEFNLAPGLPSSVDPGAGYMTQFFSDTPTYWLESQGFDFMGRSASDVVETFAPDTFDDTMEWSHQNTVNADKWLNTNVWDSNGNQVSPANVALAVGNNDYLTAQFLYDKTNGNILNIGDTYATSISTVQAQPTNKFIDTVLEILDHFGPTSNKPLAVYDVNNTALDVVNSLYGLPNAVYNINTTYNIGYYCLDVSNPRYTYTEYASYGGMTIFYNEGAPVVWWNYGPHVGGWDGIRPQSGYFVKYGHDYTLRFPQDGAGLFPDVQQNVFAPDVWPENTPAKAQHAYFVPATAFTPANNVAMDKIHAHPIEATTTINNTYDNSVANTYENCFCTTTYNTYDYSPTYEYVTEMYNYWTEPKDDEIVDTLDPTLITGDVPILSNLKNRFPFSIPWDINKMLSSLQSDRQAPVIDSTIVFPVINYEWHVVLDLSYFNSSAALFRKLFLILFIVGLAVFSYSHHFGS